MIQAGTNAVGLMLGNGMYNVPPAADVTQNSPALSARVRPFFKSGWNIATVRRRLLPAMPIGNGRTVRYL